MESLVPEEAAAITRLVRLLGEPIPYISTINEDGFGLFIRERHVIHLMLYEKQLKRFPAEIFHFPYLEILNLAGNELIEIPNKIEDLTHLTFLNVNYNHISEIPDALCRIPSLHTLLIRCNELREIPSTIEHLQSLETLVVAVNHLSEINSALLNCTRLRILDVSYNKIAQLPPEMGKLYQLQVFNLKGNILTEIPESMSNLQELVLLDLRDNPWDYFFDKFLLKQSIRIKKENIARYANFIPTLLQKIRQNESLDAFDKAYPYYLRYETVIRRFCEQNTTQTAEEVEKILNMGKYVIQTNDYKIFL